MTFPEKVKIAGYEYKVERPEKSFANGVNACDGLHQFSTQMITVSQEGNAAYQRTVFLHELVHGIIASYCGGILSDYDEERFTEQFAKGLYQVMTDNPDIFLPGEKTDHHEH